jgi:hypothetical protein
MEQKRFAKVAFSVEAFRSYVGEIEAEVEDFMNTDPAFATYRAPGKEWGKFDVLTTMQELIILTAARSLQGMDVRKRMDKSFAAMYSTPLIVSLSPQRVLIHLQLILMEASLPSTSCSPTFPSLATVAAILPRRKWPTFIPLSSRRGELMKRLMYVHRVL